MGDPPLGPYVVLSAYLVDGIYEENGGSLHAALSPYIALYCM